MADPLEPRGPDRLAIESVGEVRLLVGIDPPEYRVGEFDFNSITLARRCTFFTVFRRDVTY